jgi:hypothetical protein
MRKEMSSISIAKSLIVYIFDFRVRRILRKKVKKIIRLQSEKSRWKNPPSDVLARHRALWGKTSYQAGSLWLKMYGNISGNWDHRYIPESIYYLVAEPCLNNKAFSKCFTDKNLTSLFLKEFNGPEIIASNIDGVFYGHGLNLTDQLNVREAILKEPAFIIKPATDSGGGKNVTHWSVCGEKLVSDSGETLSVEELLGRYNANFVVQKIIEQHPFYKQFNGSSVNTVRMFTYRSVKDERIHILQTVLRVGAPGSITDNQASGGFACGISRDGAISGYAVDKNGNRYATVNGLSLENGLRLEYFNDISETARKAAAKFYYSRLLGFDFCVNKEGKVIIIEVNNLNNEINFFQMLEGPLFGEFTEEVAEWCSMKKRSFMIDYDI